MNSHRPLLSPIQSSLLQIATHSPLPAVSLITVYCHLPQGSQLLQQRLMQIIARFSVLQCPTTAGLTAAKTQVFTQQDWRDQDVAMISKLESERLQLVAQAAMSGIVLESSQIAEQEYWVCLAAPVSWVDQQSLCLLLSHLLSAEEAEPDWLIEPVLYADVSSWLNDIQQDDELAQTREFWHRFDDQAHCRENLPLFRYQDDTCDDWQEYDLDLDALQPGLLQFSREHQTELADVVTAAVRSYLTGLDKQAILARREHLRQDELSNVIGCMSQIYPSSLQGKADAIVALRAEVAAKNQAQPCLECYVRPSTMAEKNHAFVFSQLTLDAVPGARLSRLNAPIDVSRLHFVLVTQADSLTLRLQYNQRDLDASAATLIGRKVKQLLCRWLGITQDVQIPHICGNVRAAQYNHVLDWYHAQIASNQAQITEVAGRQVSLQELDKRANQIAHSLRAQGIGDNDRVALHMERSADFICAMLAVLKAGACYVPLDTNLPKARVLSILDDAGVKLVFTDSANGFDGEQIYSQLDVTQCETTAPKVEIDAENLAYVLYTSGSTGIPKGVKISHRALNNLMSWMLNSIDLGPTDNILQSTSISFDASVRGYWSALLAGANMVIIPTQMIYDLNAFNRVLTDYHISVAQMVPSLMKTFLDSQEHIDTPALRHCFLGGEALSSTLVDQVKNRLGCTVTNMYGPSECCVVSSCFQPANNLTLNIVPIGLPIDNVHYLVIDRAGKPVDIGETGELCIAGPCLFSGYLNNPELTEKSCFTEPQSGRIYYRSGDLVQRLWDGNIFFLGRIDHQIKRNGYRVELNEISSLVEKSGLGRQAQCLFDKQSQQLNLFVLDASDSEAIRQRLTEALPDYMLPNQIITLDAFPRLTNGKVDLQSLRELAAKAVEVPYLAPNTASELALAGIWQQALSLPRVGRHDDFFLLGGHSLLAMKILTQINQRFDTRLTIRDMFANTTLQALAALIDASATQKAEVIPLVDKSQPLPLSFSQQRLWFIEQLGNAGSQYNMPLAFELNGELDKAALQKTLDTILARHEILRTCYLNDADDQGLQHVMPAARLHIEELCLSDLSGSQQQQQVQQRALLEAQTRFDLSRDIMLRVTLLKLAASKHIILFTLHHIAADGWSLSLLTREFTALYQAFRQGQPNPLAELPLQFADFAQWQRNWLQGANLQQQLSYWQTQLQNLPILHDLPLDAPRPMKQSFAGRLYQHPLSSSLSQSLEHFSKQQGVSLFMLLESAFSLLIARYSNAKDVIIGTPIANRPHADLSDLLGFFLNNLVLRHDFSQDISFSAFLQRNKQLILDAYEHQHLPFEMLVDVLQPERTLSHTPLFQIMFTLQNNDTMELVLPDLAIKEVHASHQIAKYDLSLSMKAGPNGIMATWEYNSDIFTESTISALAASYEVLLQHLITAPQQNLSAVDILSPSQRQALLQHNQTQLEYEPQQHIHRKFEQMASQTPDATALIFAEQRLTFQQLNQSANQLAHHIQARGVQPGDVVAVCQERSVELLISLFAIWKAGAAYLPLDPGYPVDRLQYMLEDSGATAVLSQSDVLPILDTPEALTQICVDQLTSWSHESRSDLPLSQTSDTMAYMIYTSGSTGRPKGVMVSHRNVANFFAGLTDKLGQPGDQATWLASTSISFDISVLELFWPLCQGHTVVLQPERPKLVKEHRNLDFSLFYFAAEEAGANGDKYELLLEGARFADANGLAGVWIPERHFASFGDQFPNPSVAAAAVAAVTRRITIHSGSVVLPLHDPIRVAEEWSMVDNLSKGRVQLSMASGWHPNDFVLAPDNFQHRFDVMCQGIEQVQRLWRGESITRTNGVGKPIDVQLHPQPVQTELPIWITAGGNPETFRYAGRTGAHILTHMLGQSQQELADKVAIYREARAAAGLDPQSGKVAVMMHTFIGDDLTSVKNIVEQPFKNYLRHSLSLLQPLAKELDLDFDSDLDALLDIAFNRYFHSSALFGDLDTCMQRLQALVDAGVDEIGCLIDFGIDHKTTLAHLPFITTLQQKMRQLRAQQALLAKRLHVHWDQAALIRQHQISHLQCTPSYAREMLADTDIRQAMQGLKQLLVGGEALSRELAQDLTSVVAGQVFNMYGPTETTVWSSISVVTGNDVQIGGPMANTRFYVLNESMQMVPANTPGELYIGGDGVSLGYHQQEQLTKERFVANPVEGEPGLIYKTGDLVSWLTSGQLRYLGRDDYQLKIRGFRIEPGEIESAYLSHPQVQQAVVVASGELLLAYLVINNALQSDSLDEQLQSHVRVRLPEFMVPAAIIRMQEMPLTPNGKIDRKSLPKPTEIQQQQGVYRAPETIIEQQLCEIWQQVLGVAQIGINDNFFKVGGDSILSIRVVARSAKQGLKYSTQQLFEHQTIQSLAPHVKAEQAQHACQQPSEGMQALLPMQKWFLNDPDNTDRSYFNQSVLLAAPEALTLPMLRQMLTAVLQRHDALRLRFTRSQEQWQAEYQSLNASLPDTSISLFEYQATDQDQCQQIFQQHGSVVKDGLDIEQGQLLAACLFRQQNSGEQHILLTIHHLVIDGISWRILLGDLQLAYQQLQTGQPVQLGDKTASLQQWSHALQQLASGAVQVQREYWLAELRKPVPPITEQNPAVTDNRVAMSRDISFSLTEQETETLLTRCHQAYNTDINELLLSALYRGLRTWCGNTAFRIDMEGHGREHIADQLDISDTLGWFTSLYPLTLKVDDWQDSDPASTIMQIKELCRAVPQKGLGFGLLRQLTEDAELVKQCQGNESAILFNYLGQFDEQQEQGAFSFSRLNSGANVSPNRQRMHQFSCTSLVNQGCCHVTLGYNSASFDAAQVQQLMNHIRQALLDILQHCQQRVTAQFTPSDFPLLNISQTQISELQQQFPTMCDLYPSSSLQRGLLFHSRLEKSAYVTQIDFSLNGELNIELFAQAWQQVLAQKDIFRTAFVGSDFHQLLVSEGQFNWQLIDWQHLSSVELDKHYRQFMHDDKQAGFELDKPSLIRVALFRLAPQQAKILLTYHHALMDAWSQPLILNDVMTCYQALLQGKHATLSYAPYKHYLAWLQQQDMTQALTYWQHEVGELAHPTALDLEQFSQHNEGFGPRQLTRTLVPDATAAILQSAQKYQVTPNTLIQAAWAYLLHRYSGDEQVIFGETSAGRPAELDQVEHIAGLFINTLPVRVSIQRGQSLQHWLQGIQKQSLERVRYSYVPLPDIQKQSRMNSRMAMFDTLIAFNNLPLAEALNDNIQQHALQLSDAGGDEQTNYGLTLSISLNNQLTCRLGYRAEQFNSTAVSALLEHFVLILSSFATADNLSDLPFFDAEQHAIIKTGHQLQCDAALQLALASAPSNLTQLGLHVLNRQYQAVSYDQYGELFVTASPQLTLAADRFAPCHDVTSTDICLLDRQLYRTGLLVKKNQYNQLTFIAHCKDMLSLGGVVASLQQATDILLLQPVISDAFLMLDQEKNQLFAYVVANEPDYEEHTLRAFVRDCLASRLSYAWQPQAIAVVPGIERDRDGQVRQELLPQLTDSTAENRTCLQSDTELRLAQIWCELLALEQVNANDNFYDLGGNSLTAVRLEFAISQQFSVQVSITDLFGHPQLFDQARLIDTQTRSGYDNQISAVAATMTELPLSFAQHRLWFVDQLDPGSEQYNMPIAFELAGKLDLLALQRALQTIVERHQILRTCYALNDQGIAVQKIQPVTSVPIDIIDLQPLSGAEQDNKTQQLLEQNAKRSFDLNRDLMLRVLLVQQSEQRYTLLLTLHHIAADGWSIGVLIREFSSLYRSFSTGTTSALPALPVQYADFAYWQQQPQQITAIQKQLDYWTHQLAKLPQVHSLPLDKRRPEIQSIRGAAVSSQLDLSLTQQLKALSRKHDATLFMTLQAAFAALLSRYSNEHDIVVGTPIANRRQQATEHLIGFFVNTLVLRTDLSANPNFTSLLAQVKSHTLAAFAHQDVPFEMLVETLQPERSLSHTPLFQVMFSLQNNDLGDMQLPGLQLSPVQQTEPVAKFDLSLNAEETEQGLYLSWEYCSDLFCETTIASMGRQFVQLLQSILQDQATPLTQLFRLPSPEQVQVDLMNDTQAVYVESLCAHQLFEQYAASTPHKVALVQDETSLSYQQLDCMANQLAHHLRAQGVTANSLVGLCMNRNTQMLIALLAILKAGGAYLPIDPDYPQSRIDHMVNDAAISLVLTEQQLLARFSELAVTCLCCDDEVLLAQTGLLSELPLDTIVTPEDLMYVIYTSGSTGKPKGVMISQRNIMSYREIIRQDYAISAEDRVLQFSSVSFDMFVEELSASLFSGGTLILRNDAVMAGGLSFWAFIKQHDISVICLPTAFWHQLCTDDSLIMARETLLRTVTVGGEAMNRHAAQLWHTQLGAQVTAFNTYGPTETTIIASIFDLAQLQEHHVEVPVGLPARNTRLYILDAQQRPVPVGAVGELCIAGDRVGKGYLNQPELTASKFLPEPGQRNSLMYRSGDLVRFLPDGQIAFVGRVDEQVKIRGYRIELSEIEHHLQAHDQIQQALVMAIDAPSGDKRLVAYITTKKAVQQDVLLLSLKSMLQQQLPQFMLPSAYTVLSHIPLNGNGKIDKSALPAPDFSQLQHAYIAPKTDVELQLCQMWQHLLGLEQVGIDDNFFEIGGHSLLVTRLISEIRQTFNLNIPIKTLFSLQTVGQLASYIDSETQLNQGIGIGQTTDGDNSEEWEL
ncbi:amino acid adenylation domain-containing protein [Rheinheimera baltica]|uniref:non-ribosomal peptide synthetase n=1 Tax=Rheinheimera baltica TaxID=67576 RepID=UPI00273DE205|nr:non-ribosomal peptide synthetase [Rheinheimera baltica]MDP5144804.1 amino acid adenylation domain-containing protein [Rheinheimera baltica]